MQRQEGRWQTSGTEGQTEGQGDGNEGRGG